MIDEINGLKSDYLLNTSIDALCDYLEEKYRFDIPIIHETEIKADYQDHWQVGYDQFDGRQYRQPGTVYSFHLPILR
jgi:hypothetical protein